MWDIKTKFRVFVDTDPGFVRVVTCIIYLATIVHLAYCLTGCGAAPKYHTKSGIGIYGVHAPPQAELEAYLAAFRARTKLKVEPRLINFVAAVENCPTEGCDGMTNLTSDVVMVQVYPCLAQSALGHELVHLNLFALNHDPDIDHNNPRFDLVDHDLCLELCSEGCR